MRSIAIEGLDGSGKTTVAHELAKLYQQDGQTVVTASPYRRANELVESNLYPLWKSTEGGLQAISALKTALKDIAAEAEDKNADLVIYDRHWMTAFTEIAANPTLVETWGTNFVPTAYLATDPETAHKRSVNDHNADWMSRHNFKNYATRYQTLSSTMGEHILGIYRNDDDVSPNCIARSIKWDLQILR